MNWPNIKNNLWLAVIMITTVALWWWTGKQGAPSGGDSPALSGYEKLEHWALKDSRDNDGDSFTLRDPASGRETTFRLYFADAPEKRLHQFNRKRLEEQGAYFNQLTVEQTIQVGQQARDFALALLRSKTFTVHTKWQAVFGSERRYAYVIFDDGQDLSEKLIAAGLARIHTEGAPHPAGRSTNDQLKHLRQLELSAKAARQGAWGLR